MMTAVNIRPPGQRPTLRASTDTKVSPAVRREARKYRDLLAPSFGTYPGPVDAGGRCHGATDACWPDGADPRSAPCYVGNGLRYASVGDLLMANGTAVDRLIAMGGAELLAQAIHDDLLAPYGAACRRRGLDPQAFRGYWSGDLYSEAEARGWAMAIGRAIDDGTISGAWFYTRRHLVPYVRPLIDAGAVVYASVDRFNVATARRLARHEPRILLAAMADTAAEGRDLIAAVRPNGPMVLTCPVGNVGAWRNVVPATGSVRPTIPVGGTGVGACTRCAHCIVGRGDVVFPIH